MRIPSGVTDQGVYFVAVDSTDFTTRETGLSSFTVYRSRNNGTATAMTTPTITEVDATNMPGVYFLLCDEDMTIDSGDFAQAMTFHITHAGMAPVTREVELFDAAFITKIGDPVAIGIPGAATLAGMLEEMAGSGFDVQTDSLEQIRNRGDAAWVTATAFPSAASIASSVQTQLDDDFTLVNANIATVDANVDAILVDTGTTLPASIATIDGNVDTLISELTTSVNEPTTAPAATAKVPDMLAYLYGALRNKVDVTASAKTFHNDAGTALYSKSLSDDGTTYSEAEAS